jgi:flagellar motor protein MotB
MSEESPLEFNFWPAFADLMLALVMVLCLVLFLVAAVISFGSVNLEQVKKNQKSMIDSIADAYHAAPVQLSEETYGVSCKAGICDIEVQNELNQQRITFSDKVLFRPDDSVINAKGQEVLGIVGKTLSAQLHSIKEIQIQGHADTNPRKSGSNVELAADRSVAVFTFLNSKVGIDPAKNLMSATSFGEYKSVQRGKDNSAYDWNKLLANNSTDELKGKNRRIELVLIYRR